MLPIWDSPLNTHTSTIQWVYWSNGQDCQADHEQSRAVKGRHTSSIIILQSHIKRSREAQPRLMQWPNINSEHCYPSNSICLPSLTLAERSCPNQKQQQTEYYNQTVQKVQELQQYWPVWVQIDPGQPVWQKLIVTGTPSKKSPRTYQVQARSGARYTKNRSFIWPAVEPTNLEPSPPIPPVASATIATISHFRCSTSTTSVHSCTTNSTIRNMAADPCTSKTYRGNTVSTKGKYYELWELLKTMY